MQQHNIGNIKLFSYKRFEPVVNLTNVVTARVGGQSKDPHASLNLAFHVGDDPDAVLENRATVADALGMEPETLTIAEQVHGTRVAVIKAPDRGMGAIIDDERIAGADAMVTNVADLPLVVLVADCIALSFFDPRRHVIGLAHAGWKGSLGRIAEKTVATMTEAFECDPADIIACVSPSIGKGHYEVGQDIFDAFKKAFGRSALEFVQEDMDGTCYLDLWMVNESQLLTAGLSAANIEISEMCTACHPDLFYSHRHENGNTGRFAGLIELHASGQRAY